MRGNGALKRFIDLFFCIVIAFSYVDNYVASVSVWLNLGRPIFFKQTRIGLNEKEFRIIKLRTMTLLKIKGFCCQMKKINKFSKF